MNTILILRLILVLMETTYSKMICSKTKVSNNLNLNKKSRVLSKGHQCQQNPVLHLEQEGLRATSENLQKFCIKILSLNKDTIKFLNLRLEWSLYNIFLVQAEDSRD
jgi:hypothetical protein